MLLAAGLASMRLAATGSADVMELTLVAGNWYDERGGRIAIDSLIAINGLQVQGLTGEVAERVFANPAGGGGF